MNNVLVINADLSRNTNESKENSNQQGMFRFIFIYQLVFSKKIDFTIISLYIYTYT